VHLKFLRSVVDPQKPVANKQSALVSETENFQIGLGLGPSGRMVVKAALPLLEDLVVALRPVFELLHLVLDLRN
jgi:hypothetical protein